MKFTLLFLLLSFLIYGCKNKELPAKYLSTITVVRETGGNHNIRQTGEEATSPSHATPILPQQANTHSGTRYHIIVGSFSSAEKKRAEQLVEKLKARIIGHIDQFFPKISCQHRKFPNRKRSECSPG